jgi:hypothetical protein
MAGPPTYTGNGEFQHRKPKVPGQKGNTGLGLAPSSWRRKPKAAMERRERTSSVKLLQHSPPGPVQFLDQMKRRCPRT